ncbi:hypothetical protein HG535_0E00340 [Zygotorulaspora mrakii]|uniref:1,3-beta-glucanosyltransferase n=1 Tax=Zygotorulaspora mrakii TaxID=42260 RepID=A0A7H9B2U6_ZYGMR|nr:uncharacterized protein HG535_0E00340 [Zygotorulaspora mrakii]QLG72950.1 hypothetical protein HG535_0E00340 [Zygotorulaspora mrakii]
MLLKTLFSVAAASIYAGFAAAQDLPPIEVLGNKFFFSNNGSQFYIKGIAYQADTANATTGQSINDPLADFETCSRDIPYLQAVDTNVVRIYAVNTSFDHSQCMQALNDAGIYVIADLSAPRSSVNRLSPSWDLELYNQYTSVVDLFANYTNVLGFFAGNEVTNNYTNTDASAFVKAAIRDMKSYIRERNYRSIPVGYSSNDDEDTRVAIADYFACGDEDVKADFYGINMYEWCGNSTYRGSGYADRTAEFRNLSIPIFFSEYGCNAIRPREFSEVETLFGDDMTDVWSGGIVYMYFEESNNYGLVSIDGNNVRTLDDYNYYSSEIRRVSPSSANNASYTASSTSLSCPRTGRYWQASTDLPPTPDRNLCQCMGASLSCVVDDDVSEDDYQDLFDYVCGEISCDGIQGNGTSGDYGAYSFCSPQAKLSFVLNLYYEAQGASQSDCDFSGSASLQTASIQSGCSSALAQIGSSGMNQASASANFSGGSSSTTAARITQSGSGSVTVQGSSSSSSTHSASATKESTAISSAEFNLFQVILSSIATISVVAGMGFALA